MSFLPGLRRRARAACLAALCAAPFASLPADFSVSPIRAELKPGALSETITVTNDSSGPLRVSVKVLAWTQDATGKDVFTDTGDLVYFPRQMDVAPGAKRLVRLGAKSPAQGAERAYRLFIEEIPEQAASGAAVTFYFRFAVPVFVPPADARPQPQIGELTLERGKLRLPVHNGGTQHFRAVKLTASDGAGFSRDIPGWYSLAGTSRIYEVEIPPDVCRKAATLSMRLEADGNTSFERKIDVDPARCS